MVFVRSIYIAIHWFSNSICLYSIVMKLKKYQWSNYRLKYICELCDRLEMTVIAFIIIINLDYYIRCDINDIGENILHDINIISIAIIVQLMISTIVMRIYDKNYRC